jgi:hypothetical protein
MSNSRLVSYTRISPNKSVPRNKPIDKITIHHMAGNLSLYTIGRIFYNADRNASSNYAIESGGKVGMYVEEKDRAWTSSSSANDNRAITIEVANSSIGGEWPVSASAYKTLIDLCVDICQRNGIKKLNYTGDASGNLTEHRYFAATLCPGPFLHGRMWIIAREVNLILSAKPYPGLFPTAPIGRKDGVQYGTTSNKIRWQKYLCWYGADVAVDGSYGLDTKEKTITFQKENGLVQDGNAGDLTIAKAKTVKR